MQQLLDDLFVRVEGLFVCYDDRGKRMSEPLSNREVPAFIRKYATVQDDVEGRR